MKNSKKSYIFFLIILISLISVIWFLQISKAKYKEQTEINLEITSTPLYFEHTGTDVNIPYNNNNATLDLTIHNYINNNYTIENINYTISINNSNYNFSINEVEATENSIPLVLEGGTRNSETIGIKFNRISTDDVPESEKITMQISTEYPYIYTSSFDVTITNGTIDVEGNPTNWTKDDVTLTIVPTTEGTELTEYSFDNGVSWTTSPSKTYTENTDDIKIYAKDSIGGILGPVEIDITKIDKTAPQFNIVKDIEYNIDETEKEVDTLITYLYEPESILKNLTATDIQSGIAEIGIKCYRNETEITTTESFTEIGRYKVIYEVSDEVGNKSTLTREVLVRWPLAGKYISTYTEKNGIGIMGTGKAIDVEKDGLWKDDEETGLDETLPFASKYYYAGDNTNVNNYIKFGENTFRILNVSVNDCIKVVTGVSSETVSWSNRKIFNSDFYADWANFATEKRLFYSDDSKAVQLTDEQFAHIAEGKFYAGRFVKKSSQSLATLINKERTANNHLGGNEESEFSSYFAVPNVSDYIKANNIQDKVYNIAKTQSNQSDFSNNCWMCESSKEQWTMNSKNDTSTDNDFWVLYNGDEIISRTRYYAQHYRMVFYLNNKTIISGSGSMDNPFKVEENWAWFDQYQQVQ